MPMNKTKLYSLSFYVKHINLEPNAISDGSKVTANVTFLDYRQQMLFEPAVVPPESGPINLNAGKTFTFGLNRHMECDLAKEFIIRVILEQTDPAQCLSEARMDITKIFLGVFKDYGLSNPKTKINTTLVFTNGAGERLARMDVLVRLFPSGPTIVNEFVMDSDVPTRPERVSARSGGCGCPKPPGFKPPEGVRDDDGEWDIMCADMKNGQKIAIKYKRSYYGLTPAEDDERCAPLDAPCMSRSDEKLNVRMLGLMEQMHKMITDKATAKN